MAWVSKSTTAVNGIFDGGFDTRTSYSLVLEKKEYLRSVSYVDFTAGHWKECAAIRDIFVCTRVLVFSRKWTVAIVDGVRTEKRGNKRTVKDDCTEIGRTADSRRVLFYGA